MKGLFTSDSPSLIVVLVITVLVLFVYIVIKSKYNYWKKNNIFFSSPSFFVGNIGSILKLKENEAQMYDRLYHSMKENKIAGSFYFWKPVLLVKDIELVKKITVKDFDHFHDHPGISDFSSTDKIVYSLFTMTGSLWKDRRSKFVSSFSLKKVKDSFETVVNICNTIIPRIEENINDDFELESLISTFTANISTNVLFKKMKINSSSDNNNVFLECGKLVSHPPVSTVAKIILYTLFPNVYRALRLQTLSPKIHGIFINFVREIVKFREEEGIIADDVLGTLLKLKNEGTDITDDEMAGHIYSFFEAGYDSTTITTSYSLYELSRSPGIQSRLRQETETAFVNGKLQYDILQSLPYLELVIKETLRKYPPAGILKRECTKPFMVDSYTIPKGMTVVIPVHSLHRDPEYYHDPEAFLPEREYPTSAPYLPFGLGPRICIGMKSAELAVKVGLATILKNFDILPPLNHSSEVEFDPKTIFITVRPKNGIWVRMKRRNENIYSH